MQNQQNPRNSRLQRFKTSVFSLNSRLLERFKTSVFGPNSEPEKVEQALQSNNVEQMREVLNLLYEKNKQSKRWITNILGGTSAVVFTYGSVSLVQGILGMMGLEQGTSGENKGENGATAMALSFPLAMLFTERTRRANEIISDIGDLKEKIKELNGAAGTNLEHMLPGEEREEEHKEQSPLIANIADPAIRNMSDVIPKDGGDEKQGYQPLSIEGPSNCFTK